MNTIQLTQAERDVCQLTRTDPEALLAFKRRRVAQLAGAPGGVGFVPSAMPRDDDAPLLEKCIRALVGTEAPTDDERARALEALGLPARPNADDVRKQLCADGYGLSPTMTVERIREQLARIGVKLAPLDPAPEELLTAAEREVCRLTGTDPRAVARFRARTQSASTSSLAPSVLVTLSAVASRTGRPESCTHATAVRLSGPRGPAPYCRDCGAALELRIGA